MSNSKYHDEKEYWLQKLQGCIGMSSFPADSGTMDHYHYNKEVISSELTDTQYDKIIKAGNHSEYAVYLILLSGVKYLLHRYSDVEDIMVGMPCFLKEKVHTKYNENLFALRTKYKKNGTFKELLLDVMKTVNEAKKYSNIPYFQMAEYLDSSASHFKTIVCMENVHNYECIKDYKADIKFSFIMKKECIEICLEYNAILYSKAKATRIIEHLANFLDCVTQNAEVKLSEIDILSSHEKKRILHFNDTGRHYFGAATIYQLFEQQVQKTPDNIALKAQDSQLTYRELNQKVEILAVELSKYNLTPESVIAVLMERTQETIVCLLAILKVGGVYLPIDVDCPVDRLTYILEDSRAKILITTSQTNNQISFTQLQNLKENIRPIVVTAKREPIEDFSMLPRLDRTFINLNNYKNKIGMASAKNCISIQATRGCPYSCIFCHKIWPKSHTFRDASHIFDEIEFYYKQGVTNFSFLDDCFNLDANNSSRLFQLIKKSKMKIKIFFPNGLRGDLLTKDYIDLMIEAGVVNINLSLETASPRLQKLIKKNLDLDRFRENIEYIAQKHKGVLLELAAMHGFPSETEAEAMMTLNFIKSIKWLHFPYIHILKIYPNTDMEAVALQHGVAQNDIINSVRLAYHEIPETIHFSKTFTRKYQSEFLNDYFLAVERLKQVIPTQLALMGEEVMVQKYRTYLPAQVNSLADILRLADLEEFEFTRPDDNKSEEDIGIFDKPMTVRKCPDGAKKILLLDLSQHFSHYDMLYHVNEQPLGLLYLMTYLNREFGDKIFGKIAKSGIDFDSYDELKEMIEAFQPDLIGIRTLSFYREFFHQTITLIKQWGIKCPIIMGGPYATSDYQFALQDRNIELAILGEGEIILTELVQKMLENNFKIPNMDALKKIKGIAYANKEDALTDPIRTVILYDKDSYVGNFSGHKTKKLPQVTPNNLAYIIYTSGTTGKPKGVMVEHRQVQNCLSWMQDVFKLNEKDFVVQRTNLMFDPSVWEIFWPLMIGAGIRFLPPSQSRNAEFIIDLLSDNKELTLMYCPASLLNGMTYILKMKKHKYKLKLPWLLIGAEPISVDTVKSFYEYFEGQIVNTYGPTECTINNTYYVINRNEDRSYIPIGKPISNNQVYILSQDMQLMPCLVPGEISIAGDSVSRGYLNHPEKESERFVDNPFGKGKLYKSGDIGMWDEDGNIKIMGRIDNQVKLRGYRIELGEIETIIKDYKWIKDAVVTVTKSDDSANSIRTCKECGITSNYPQISINSHNICNICERADEYIQHADKYFKTMADLKSLIEEENRERQGSYDCILVYACERVATYALYKLVEMEVRVLTATYDHGHISTKTKENIEAITSAIGVGHVFLKHKNSDNIMRESLKSAQTMCKGCIHTSASLAGEYAYKNDIPIVIGETLSRGQIIENKLIKFFKLGITEPKQIEKELANVQATAPDLDKSIFDQIDITEIKNKSLYEHVKFLDFYRYCDAADEEIVSYLSGKNRYWEELGSKAIYSTDCFICHVGDYNFYHEKGYHYNGGAKSWEKRLGHITLENLKSDLKFKITQTEYENFMKIIKYEKSSLEEKISDQRLCAYIISDKKLEIYDLREYLKKKLPEYMMPSYFIKIDKIPLTSSGKIDWQALPEPGRTEITEELEVIMAPNEKEIKMLQVWREVLGMEQIGVNDNFFHIGGDSIKAIQTAMNLAKDFDISINDIFKYQTIRELARHVEMKSNNMKEKIQQIKALRENESKANHILSKETIAAKKRYCSKIKEDMELDHNHQISYNNILITGGTGFFGTHIVGEILESKSSNVYVLVRGKSDEVSERFRKKLNFYFGDNTYEKYQDRIFILNGDITKDNLGLSQDMYNQAANTIDGIINAAANVKLFGQYEEFYETNVNGIQRLIEFALQGQKKHLQHISTLSIADGTVPHEKELLFTEYDCNIGQEIDSFYLKTKIEAEEALLLAAKNGLKYTIYRVGNLVFHSQTGKFQENIGDNAFYATIKAFIMLKKVPDISSFVKNYNFSFVDCASKAIIQLMDRQESANAVFHLFNTNVVGLRDIYQMIKNNGFEIELLSIGEFCDYLSDNFDNPEISPYIESIVLHSGLVDTKEKTRFDLEYERTDTILKRIQFYWPKVSDEHLNKMIYYCKEIKYL
jgi:amino acid adenylation domain-containing protein/thioester reductase-like protein